MTNLIATILFLTNIVETLEPSGDSKVRTETIVAVVMVPGWLTNSVPVSTNTTRWVWSQSPMKLERTPLDVRDQPPPLPPNSPAPEARWFPAPAAPKPLVLAWKHDPPDPRVEFVVESSVDLLVWQERSRQTLTSWPIPLGETHGFFRVASTWRP